MMNKENNYGSVAVEDQSIAFGMESSPSVKGATNRHFLKCALAAIALFGCFATLADPSGPSANTASEVNLLATTEQEQQTNAGPNLLLPSYLEALGPGDPEYESNASKLTSKYTIAEPTKGNMIPGRVEIVRFTEPHFVFRYYGGSSSQCGYWWVLDPPTGTEASYSEHFAICPEYGPKSDIVRCRIPAGYVTVVGEGQSIKCAAGNVLMPDASNLQMNGDVCTDVIKMERHLACEYCDAHNFDLESSACSNKGPDYIDGFEFSDGD